MRTGYPLHQSRRSADTMSDKRDDPISPPVNRPILEVMEEVRSKLRLLEGETKSLCENSYRSLREAKQRAHKLRENNRKLRLRIAEHDMPDEITIARVSGWKFDRQLFLPHLTTSQILDLVDGRIAKQMNQLNMLRYKTRLRQEKLSHLDTQAKLLELEWEQMKDYRVGDEVTNQAIRVLENKIDKTKIKQSEVIHIGRTYAAIKDKMQEETLTYASTADAIQYEIERCARKLQELRPIFESAISVREKTKTELQRHEELTFAQRKRREMELISMRRIVESKKDKPITHKNPLLEQELRKLDPEAVGDEMEEELASESQTRLNHLSRINEQLKQITGYFDLTDIVKRMEELMETGRQLERLRAQNDHRIKQLKLQSKTMEEHLALLRIAYEYAKDKLESSKLDHKAKEEESVHSRVKLRDDSKDKQQALDRINLTLEHLYKKLVLVSIFGRRDKKRPVVKEFPQNFSPVELLGKCNGLQQQLERDLEEYDISEEEERLEEALCENVRSREEYQDIVERRIPNNAVRTNAANKKGAWVGGSGTDEVDQEVLTRDAIKQRSRMIVENAKRKTTRNTNRKQFNLSI
ncbi:hypothetical protein T265_09298 [Opisthorchis viverrini]|uniref:Uncharacterized protein n=1 Tax=Opisthorchis viverrini TaxID=6198 RepID=A0A074ZHH1_OPIVI|nr:hypothetical protein T265_09298 [Opisthorchis viverrini]KER22675.1 hypothetical protein T265_09298 [Opisthorchis viverrini]